MNEKYIRLLCAFALCVLLMTGCGEDKQGLLQVTVLDTFEDQRNIEMVQIPGGSFRMGSTLDTLFRTVALPSGRIDTIYNFERPVHVVVLSSFMISTTEITQAQFEAITGSNPSKFRGYPDNPVEQVTWFEAADFCNLLSEQQGLAKCYDGSYKCNFSANGFRLPTESEWEYAARAGNTSEYFTADTPVAIAEGAWYLSNSDNSTHQVATRQANQYGLYDTSGNVAEWTYDVYGYYSCSSERDPVGAEIGYYRVGRGGSWASGAKELRSAARAAYPPDRKLPTLGFRIARRP